MKRHRLISAVATVALLVATPAALGSADGDEIVGGTPASPGEYPAQGALIAAGGLCGGTLISPTLFLTAAHCVVDFGQTISPQDMFVYMGDVDLELPNPPENFFDVVMVDVHAGYDAPNFRNDLAMLMLDRPAPHQPMRVIRLDEAAKWAPTTPARIIGWGATVFGGGANPELLKADAPIRSDDVCAEEVSYGTRFDPSTMVCAGVGITDTCQGDSGGPLMVADGPAFVLVGVTSWGDGCADPDFPGVYVRLGAPALNGWVNGSRPQASFTVGAAHVGASVTFTSNSANPEGSFSVFNWDLNGDGAFDDATGPSTSRVYTAPGPVSIGLEAIQPGGDHAIARQTLTVNALPSAVAGGPSGYTVREGGTVRLMGNGTDPEGQVLSYSWDLNGDGVFEVSGQTTSFSALSLDGPTTRSTVLRVCDSVGGCATASAIVRVTNAPPRANAGRDRRVKRGRRVRFFVRATDPGRDALRATWRIAGRTKRGSRVTHVFRRPGRYVVRVTVTDGDGGVARDVVRVRVRR